MAKGFKSGGAVKGQTYSKVTVWNEMGDYIASEGTDKYMAYLKGLPDKEFADRFEAILEYFKPKLSRAAVTDGDGKPLFPSTSQKQQADTIISKFLGRNKNNPK